MGENLKKLIEAGIWLSGWLLVGLFALLIASIIRTYIFK